MTIAISKPTVKPKDPMLNMLPINPNIIIIITDNTLSNITVFRFSNI